MSVLILKKKLAAYHWTGMGICTLGVFTVGLSSILQGGSGSGTDNSALGSVLIILGTFSTAVSYRATVTVMWQSVFTLYVHTCMLLELSAKWLLRRRYVQLSCLPRRNSLMM